MKLGQISNCLLSSLYRGIIVFALAINSTFASNGWVSSGGDDLPFNYGASWYTNRIPKVYYCTVANKNYIKAENELRDLIEKSINRWKSYYQKKLPYFTISQDSLAPNFNWQYEKKCTEKTQVKFYFDSEDKRIKKNKLRYYNPFSFAAFEEKTKRGILWFSNPHKVLAKPNANALEVLLTHELGHVFGVPHLKNTIMKEDITKDLEKEELFVNIDGSSILLYNTQMDFKINGKFGNAFNMNEANELLFEKFTGRKPVGTIYARLENPTHRLTPMVKLFVGDETGEVQLKIDNTKTLTLETSNQWIFRTIEPLDSGGIYNDGLKTQSWLGLSSIEDSQGRHFPLFISTNRPFIVRFQDTNELKILFNNGI